jgi:hypothetical protein
MNCVAELFAAVFDALTDAKQAPPHEAQLHKGSAGPKRLSSQIFSSP